MTFECQANQAAGDQRGSPATFLSQATKEWESEGGRLSDPCANHTAVSMTHADRLNPETALLDAMALGVLITNRHGEITYSNTAFRKIAGTSESELRGRHWSGFLDAESGPAIPASLPEATVDEHPLIFDARLITGTGKRIWTRHSIVSLVSDQVSEGHIHTIEDISAMKAAEKTTTAAHDALLRECERARVTLECIGDAVISTDAGGQVTYLNAVAEDLTGWSREAALGQPFSRVFKVVDSDTGEPVRNPAERAMESLEVVEIPENCLLMRPDGSEQAIEDSAAPILDADGHLTGAVVIFRDHKMSRENTSRMAHLARHDALTGLPNRVAFAEHFEQAIKLAQRHQKQVGLLFIDLDNFKQINDNLGHKAGDRLLRDLSRKLTACVRSTDLVCRHGGDEFVVLLSEINDSEDAGGVAAKMWSSAARPVHVQGQSVELELSIGISLYPDDGDDLESLMQKADTAMYRAKLYGGGGYCFYREHVQRPPSASEQKRPPPM